MKLNISNAIKQHRKAWLLVIILAAGAMALYAGSSNFRNKILNSSELQRIVHIYRSFIKIPDIFYIPIYAIQKSELPLFEITINPNDIDRLNQALPVEPFSPDIVGAEKIWVDAYFRAPGYEDNVRIRYRGDLSSNWNALQKSYQIKFQKENLFLGMRELNLVIPSRRFYLAMSLNNYRAEKLGLIHPEETYVRMRVNGADQGVMLAFENWSQEWLEKMPIQTLSTIYGVDVTGGTPVMKSWSTDTPDFSPLLLVVELVTKMPDKEFKKYISQIVDVDEFLKQDVMHILASGYHVTNLPESPLGSNNLVLIFDRSTGMLRPVPYHSGLYSERWREESGQEDIVGNPTVLMQRILSIPEFRQKRDELFKNYATLNKESDIKFSEEWLKSYKKEFYKDNAKIDNNITFLQEVKSNIQAVEDYFSDPFNIIEKEYFFEPSGKDVNYPKMFERLPDSVASPEEFVRKNPSFVRQGTEVHLYSGRYYFNNTIVIPVGMKLVIHPEVKIYMGSGASIISYSPVEAIGTESRPISIEKSGARPWGVFAILNTERTRSSVVNVHLSGGSEDTVNGIYFTGMLSMHNSDGEIFSSVFRESYGDDALNIKGGSVQIHDNFFTETSMDGIDGDFPLETTSVENNMFLNLGGDGMDLSWSNISISKNTVEQCADKGISIGERSYPIIIENSISNCDMGIAVKDQSKAIISSNTLSNNRVAVSLYRKKLFFGGGEAVLKDNVFTDNTETYFTDSLSKITLDETSE